MAAPLHVVTGALGYTGRALTARLLAAGHRVRTLTNSPGRPNPFGPALEIHPLAFGDPGALCRSLEGAAVLHNTYWVRFDHRLFTFAGAVRDTKALFAAAARAGVGRIVHVSILHADEADDLGYYRGKHELEDALRASGLPHSIVRPGVLFGRGDILVNNIAWVLRHLPLFGVFGDGGYALRPLFVDDMAALMAAQAQRTGNSTVDAVGPERFTYLELVRALRAILGVRRPIVRVPPWLGHAAGRLLNPFVGDVVITREEIAGLVRGLLDSEAAAAGPTALSEWARAERATLGKRYASEVRRRTVRDRDYAAI
ncbi:MAG: NAD-dependent epimerase/dehydratase family protein [Planctomycetes bacterium]|nr:NAD-dependent epimerase/dehydratase family protein [Planctomycetota bacterium]